MNTEGPCNLAACHQELGSTTDHYRRKPQAREMLFYLLDFVWTAKGGWQYIAHHDNNSMLVTVSMPHGTMAPFTHLVVDNAQKTLGVVTCPAGDSVGSLHQMKKKAQKWLDSLTAGRLHH